MNRSSGPRIYRILSPSLTSTLLNFRSWENAIKILSFSRQVWRTIIRSFLFFFSGKYFRFFLTWHQFTRCVLFAFNLYTSYVLFSDVFRFFLSLSSLTRKSSSSDSIKTFNFSVTECEFLDVFVFLISFKAQAES